MISHWMRATMRAGKMMDSLVGGSMDDSYCLDRASALVFREPGRYVTVKSNRVKNRDNLAFWRISDTQGCDDRSTRGRGVWLPQANDAIPRRLLSWREVLGCPHRSSVQQG